MLALLLLVCLFQSNQLLVIQAYTDVSDTFGFLWQFHELDNYEIIQRTDDLVSQLG